MWKFTLLVAVLANIATSYGSNYSDNLYRLMNRDENICGVSTYDVNNQCDVTTSGCNSDLLKAKFNEAMSLLERMCIENLTNERGEEDTVTTVRPLTQKMIEIGFYARNSLQCEMLTVLNMDNTDELRCLTPKQMNAERSTDSIDFAVFASSRDIFTDYAKNCYDIKLGGEIVELDFSSGESLVDGLNAWFAAQGSYSGNVVSADDINDSQGVILGSYHTVELSFGSSFNFYEKTNIEFKKNDLTVVQQPAWIGQGDAYVAELKDLNTWVYGIPLENGGSVIVLKPKAGQENMQNLLSELVDMDNFIESLMANAELTTISLTMPLYMKKFGKEDYVDGLKSKNLLPSLYDPNSTDIVGVSSDGSYIHVSHMFNVVEVVLTGIEEGEVSDIEPQATHIIDNQCLYIIMSDDEPIAMGTLYGD